MSSPVLSEEQDHFLRRMPNAILGTNRRDGGPNLTPNWYYWDGVDFLISAPDWTSKVHNVRRDPRASLCIDDPVSGLYVTAYGHATIIEQAEAREPTFALLRKYREEQDVIPHWERINANRERVVIVVHPDRLFWRRR